MLATQFRFTNSTIGNHVVTTDSGTSGIDMIFFYCFSSCMACCGDLGNVDLFIASYASKRLTAGNRTHRFRINVPFAAIIVSECGNRRDIFLRSAPRAVHRFATRFRTGGTHVYRPSGTVIMLTLCSGQYLHFQQLLTQGTNASLHLGCQTGCRVDHSPSTESMATNVIDRRTVRLSYFIFVLNITTIHTSKIICSVILISIEDLGHQLKQTLHPFFGYNGFLVRMIADGNRFRSLRTARCATAIDRSGHCTRCGYGLFHTEIMSLTRQNFGIPVTAAYARIENASIFKASRRRGLRAVSVSCCRDEISSNPFTANRANSLVATLLGTGGRSPDCIRKGMLAANMLAVQYKGMILAHCHPLGITDPTVHQVSLLFCNLGSNDRASVRQTELCKQGGSIFGIKPHGIGGQTDFKYGIGMQINCRGGGHAVGNTVTVKIPSNQYLGILCSLFGHQFGLTDDLRGQEEFITEKISVFIIKFRNNPFVAVHNSVVVVPERIDCIPAQIGCQSVDVYGYTPNAIKRIQLHGYGIHQNDIFQGYG